MSVNVIAHWAIDSGKVRWRCRKDLLRIIIINAVDLDRLWEYKQYKPGKSAAHRIARFVVSERHMYESVCVYAFVGWLVSWSLACLSASLQLLVCLLLLPLPLPLPLSLLLNRCECGRIYTTTTTITLCANSELFIMLYMFFPPTFSIETVESKLPFSHHG